eukprot:871612-Prorocentrum_lima.AAC.1
MTSSLVGSEMCIRDRLQICCLCAGAGLDGRADYYLDPKLTKRIQLMQCAVSYTHLTLPTICSV